MSNNWDNKGRDRTALGPSGRASACGLIPPVADVEVPDECDIVMKGGITSGVVYPSAVHELSATYDFRNIGGTSAGAIAAAGAAAAMFRRNSVTGPERDDGFTRLALLQAELGATVGDSTRLFSLFQPDPTTRPLFNTAVAGLKHADAGRVEKTARVLGSALWELRRGVVVGAGAPAVALGLLARRSPGAALLAAGVANALLGATVGAGVQVRGIVGTALPANFYGLVTGHAPEGSEGPAPVTDWLADLIDEIAGRVDDEGRPVAAPLTFGELWGARDDGEAWAMRRDPSKRAVNLEMLTTNLTLGRPFRLPFNERNDFCYLPGEWERLFPRRVLAHLEAVTKPVDAPGGLPDRLRGLRTMPPPQHLPLVVAARMSLSFPALFSAVPLWLREYEAPGEPFGCTWFSDGGIASNFPMHFFDSPLPRRPTFGINLRPFTRAVSPDERQNVDLLGPGGETGDRWSRLPDQGGIDAVVAFFRLLLDTLQNWSDNARASMPGYRERIAHVSLTAEEGGMNLAMPAQRLEVLSRRGREAAATLRDAYRRPGPEPDGLSWTDHRWVRARSSLSMLENLLAKVAVGAASGGVGDRYRDLLGRPEDDQPRFHQLERAAGRARAQALLDSLVEAAADAPPADSVDAVHERAPRPGPELLPTHRF